MTAEEMAPEFSSQLMRMQALFHRQLFEQLADTPLSTGQPKVLAFLKSHEGKSQKEIADSCQLEPGSVSVLLARMEEQGLIIRTFAEDNRKTRRVFLTERGKALAGRVVESFYAVETKAFEGFSEAECELLTGMCSRLIYNLTDA